MLLVSPNPAVNRTLRDKAAQRRLPQTFARPQTVGRTGWRVSRAGYGRLRRPNQRMEPMALRATAHPPPRSTLAAGSTG